MRRLRAALIRLVNLFRRGRLERELAAEMDGHLQLHIDDNIRAGMTPVEARRQAKRAAAAVEAGRAVYNTYCEVADAYLSALYEAVDTIFYRPPEVTKTTSAPPFFIEINVFFMYYRK